MKIRCMTPDQFGKTLERLGIIKANGKLAAKYR